MLLHDEETGWSGHSVEMPFVFGFGRDPNACVREIRELLVTAIAVMLENKEKIARPPVDEPRDEQLNMRVSLTEKAQLETSARRGRFRNVSDYVRTAALHSDARED